MSLFLQLVGCFLVGLSVATAPLPNFFIALAGVLILQFGARR
jgi:hypothetical protein